MNSLSGKVAGVNIQSSNRGIGGATRVVMRGSKSITKDNSIVRDEFGVHLFSTPTRADWIKLMSMPISLVERVFQTSSLVMTKHVGAGSCRCYFLYGSNAANGAIVNHNLKKGATGKPKVNNIKPDYILVRLWCLISKTNTETKQVNIRSWGDVQNKYAYNPSDFSIQGATSQTSATLSGRYRQESDIYVVGFY